MTGVRRKKKKKVCVSGHVLKKTERKEKKDRVASKKDIMTDREQVNKGKRRSWQLCRSQNQMPAENCINVELPKQIPWLPSLYRDSTPNAFSALGFTCRWFIAVHNARLACLTAIFATVVDGGPLWTRHSRWHGWPAYVRNSLFTLDNRIQWAET